MRMRGFAVEDTAAALFQFDNGCLGTLVLTDAGLSPWTIEQGSEENPNFPHTGQSAYRLVGTQGSLELPVLRTGCRALRARSAGTKPLTATDIAALYHDPYQAQLRHFQRLIRLNEAPMVSVVDGANSLAATLAVAQSSAQGRTCTPARFIAG